MTKKRTFKTSKKTPKKASAKMDKPKSTSSKANNSNGEIRTEFLSPRNLFFDQAVARVDLLDGSTETLVVAQPKPKSWFKYYFPDIDVVSLPTAEGFQQLGAKRAGVGI